MNSEPVSAKREPGRVWRGLALGVLVILLVASVYNAVVDGMPATHYADTPGMQLATVTQLMYGGFALAALVGLVAKRSWTIRHLFGWALSASITAGLAPVVYAQQPVLIGVLSGAAAALLLFLLVWAWRRTARRP